MREVDVYGYLYIGGLNQGPLESEFKSALNIQLPNTPAIKHQGYVSRFLCLEKKEYPTLCCYSASQFIDYHNSLVSFQTFLSFSTGKIFSVNTYSHVLFSVNLQNIEICTFTCIFIHRCRRQLFTCLTDFLYLPEDSLDDV